MIWDSDPTGPAAPRGGRTCDGTGYTADGGGKVIWPELVPGVHVAKSELGYSHGWPQ